MKWLEKNGNTNKISINPSLTAVEQTKEISWNLIKLSFVFFYYYY